MEDEFTVVVEGSKKKVPVRLCKVSNYLQGMMSLGFEEDEEVEIERVSKETFEEVLEFYQFNNFEPVLFKTPIKTNEISTVLNEANAKFIERHPLNSPEFKSLYSAAEFLGCKELLRVCAVRYACLLYFEDGREHFEQKQLELGVKVEMEFKHNEQFKKLFPFLNQQH